MSYVPESAPNVTIKVEAEESVNELEKQTHATSSLEETVVNQSSTETVSSDNAENLADSKLCTLTVSIKQEVEEEIAKTVNIKNVSEQSETKTRKGIAISENKLNCDSIGQVPKAIKDNVSQNVTASHTDLNQTVKQESVENNSDNDSQAVAGHNKVNNNAGKESSLARSKLVDGVHVSQKSTVAQNAELIDKASTKIAVDSSSKRLSANAEFNLTDLFGPDADDDLDSSSSESEKGTLENDDTTQAQESKAASGRQLKVASPQANSLVKSKRANEPEDIPAQKTKLYSCIACGMSFQFFSTWKAHLERDVKKLSYECKHCDKKVVVYNKCKLTEHIRMHGDDAIVPDIVDLASSTIPKSYHSLEESSVEEEDSDSEIEVCDAESQLIFEASSSVILKSECNIKEHDATIARPDLRDNVVTADDSSCTVEPVVKTPDCLLRHTDPAVERPETAVSNNHSPLLNRLESVGSSVECAVEDVVNSPVTAAGNPNFVVSKTGYASKTVVVPSEKVEAPVNISGPTRSTTSYVVSRHPSSLLRPSSSFMGSGESRSTHALVRHMSSIKQAPKELRPAPSSVRPVLSVRPFYSVKPIHSYKWVSSIATQASLQKPHTAGSSQAISVDKPSIAVGKIAVAIDKPLVAIDKLADAVKKRTVGVDKPSAAVDKPPVADDKIAVEKPAAVDKPTVAVDKTAVVNNTPSIEADKPAVAVNRRAVLSSEPVCVGLRVKGFAMEQNSGTRRNINIHNPPGDSVCSPSRNNIPKPPGNNVYSPPRNIVRSLPGNNVHNLQGNNVCSLKGNNVRSPPGNNIHSSPGNNVHSPPGNNICTPPYSNEKICSECKKIIPSGDIQSHFQTPNPALSVESVHCKICPLILPTVCSFNAHTRIHNKQMPFVCPECGCVFPTLDLLKIHLPKVCFHIQKSVCYCCTLCKILYKTPDELTEHILRSKHFMYIFICSVCSLYRNNYKELELHLKQHKSSEEKPAMKMFYQCQLCPERLITVDEMRFHATIHPKRLDSIMYYYTCSSCNFVAYNKERFSAHQEVCSGEASVQNCVRPSHTLIVKPKASAKPPQTMLIQALDVKGNVTFQRKLIRSNFVNSLSPTLVSPMKLVKHPISVLNVDMIRKKTNPVPNTNVRNKNSGPFVNTDMHNNSNSVPNPRMINFVDANADCESMYRGGETSENSNKVQASNAFVEENEAVFCNDFNDAEGNEKDPLSLEGMEPSKTTTSLCIVCGKCVERSLIRSGVQRTPVRCASCVAKSCYESKSTRNGSVVVVSPKNISGSNLQLPENGPPKKKRRLSSCGTNEKFKCHICSCLLPVECSTIQSHYRTVHDEDISLTQELLEQKINSAKETVNSSTEEDNITEKKVGVEQCVRNGGCTKSKRKKRVSKSADNKNNVSIAEPVYSNSDNLSESADNESETKSEHNENDLREGYACKFGKCQFSTSDACAFREHIISHRSREFIYQCMECGYACKSGFSLSCHLVIKHCILDVEGYAEDKKECYFGRESESSDYDSDCSWDESRMKGNSEDVAENECRVCREIFDSSQELEQHIRNHGMAFLVHMRKNRNK